MIDRAPHENLEGQLDMWRDHWPDRDGQFDAAGVAETCRRHEHDAIAEIATRLV